MRKKALFAVPVLAIVATIGGLVSGHAAAADQKPPRWLCTLTGKTVDSCCCVTQKDGKLYCTLAKKTVDKCCCKAAEQK
ncbi:MAG TPA: hypothetical protein VGK86_02895 [Thermoanaerobaculia bacterium]|jgi:hypothetical protein